MFKMFGVEDWLVDILFEVNQLSIQFSITSYSTSPHEGLLVLGQLSSVLQGLLQLSPVIGTNLSVSGISESCRYAGALHILFPLMGNYPDPTFMVNALVHKLKECLIYFIPHSGIANTVLLWCLAVGGVSALGMPERNWFTGHLAVVAADLDIPSWDEVKACLMGVMSHAIFCEDSFHTLWDEVVAKIDD
jgi:hypothetical protein